MRIAVVIGLAVGGALFAGAARAGEEPYGSHPRLGGRAGRSRSYISRHPSEAVPIPDVVTLKGGLRHEAYFLSVYGDRLVYYVLETDRSWLREEVAREEVEAIDFEQYLETNPVAPRKIEPARKQPVPKESILSGVFSARQGRSTRWTAVFHSEIDVPLDYSEDSTEYGTFEIESATAEEMDERDLPPRLLPRGGTWWGTQDRVAARPPRHRARSHTVRSTGKYYLHAPGTVANDEWVLVLSGVIQNETDHGEETMLSTVNIPDEILILYFSPARNSFRLAWSNLGAWTWTSIVGLPFERLEASAPVEPVPVPSRRLRGDRPPAPAGGRGGARADREGAIVASAPEKRWGIHGWRRPASRWGASSR
ncbi:MAG: hypothetical protein HY721_35705 [Planctomycetes bacterium]|nr:hypothetical protein [Planctomycetota bacterium]